MPNFNLRLVKNKDADFLKIQVHRIPEIHPGTPGYRHPNSPPVTWNFPNLGLLLPAQMEAKTSHTFMQHEKHYLGLGTTFIQSLDKSLPFSGP